jgi:hypothetical protein
MEGLMKMEKRFRAVLLAAVLCLSGVFTVFADGKEYKDPQTRTIVIPEIPNLEITMNGAYDMYACYLEAGNITDKEYFFTLAPSGSAVTFNEDVMIYQNYNDEIYVAAGDTVEIGENGYGSISMIATGEDLFLNIDELNSGAYEYGTAVRIVFRANSDTAFNAGDDELNGMEVLPVSDSTVSVESVLTENPASIDGNIDSSSVISAEGVLTAIPTASAVYVNGENVSFDAYNISENNYFKLRDIAFILNGTEKQFAVAYDETADAISLTSVGEYIAVGGEMQGRGYDKKLPAPTNSKILLNGEEVNLVAYT